MEMIPRKMYFYQAVFVLLLIRAYSQENRAGFNYVDVMSKLTDLGSEIVSL